MLNAYEDMFSGFMGALYQKRPQFGILLQNPVTAFAEIVGLSGFDFAWIDMEHTSMTFHDVETMIIALERQGCLPLVRVRDNDPNQIGLALDLGARIVNIPHVDTVTDAERAVYGAKYYPLGRRGYATSSRSTSHGIERLDLELMKARNKQTMLMAQIESVEAVGNAEAIAGVEGIDALFVGYADLCQDMGIDPDPRHPRCAEAIRHVGNAIGKTGKTGALSVSDPARISLYRDLGFMLFVCGIDTIIMKTAMVQLAASLKKNGLP